MIEDFLSYIDESFPYLNPYDGFHQCKGNTELINRRISNLLKALSPDESLVKYNPRWGYYLETSAFRQIQQIGLTRKPKENDYSIELGLYFGASQRQAIAFYNSNPDISQFKNTKWKLVPKFHVQFMTTNLVFFESDDREHYLQFWKNNVGKIRRQKRADVSKYLKWLVDEKVIKLSKETEEELKEKFYSTAMQNLNMCPEFGVVYSFSSSEAEELDKGGKLKFLLADKIKEGLRVVGLDGKEILRKL